MSSFVRAKASCHRLVVCVLFWWRLSHMALRLHVACAGEHWSDDDNSSSTELSPCVPTDWYRWMARSWRCRSEEEDDDNDSDDDGDYIHSSPSLGCCSCSNLSSHTIRRSIGICLLECLFLEKEIMDDCSSRFSAFLGTRFLSWKWRLSAFE